MNKNIAALSKSQMCKLMPHSRTGVVLLTVIVFSLFMFGAMIFSADNVSAETTDKDSKWTCSMHPQIMLPSSGQCPLCGMDLIPVPTDDGLDTGERSIRMSPSAIKLAGISTTPVERKPASLEIRMVGTVAYDETRLAYITSWVPGRLDRLYADYTGITVNKGDHMVYLYSPELMATQEELIQAKIASAALQNSSSSLLASADKTITAVRKKLSLYGLSDDQISEIERSGKASDHLTINAPVGGVVIHKNAKEGMYVKTGTRIYTIADLSHLWILFDAYETDLNWLRYGQKVEFSLIAYPGEKFSGNITFIDPVLNPRTRTAKVRVIVDNSDARLKPDMFVSGTVYSQLNADGDVIDENLVGKWIGPMHPEIIKDGPGSCDICDMPLVPAESLPFAIGVSPGGLLPLVIPATAPLITGRRAVVYVEQVSDEGNVYEGREVTLGPRVGDSYIVMAGLEEGESVVVNGAFKIDAELQIRAKPSMMSPQGGGGQSGHQHGQAAMVSVSEEVKHSGHEMDASSTEKSIEEPVSLEARQALTPIYNAYFMAQTALASDSFALALAAFDSLSNSVKKVNMALFTGESHMKWMTLSKQLTDNLGADSKNEDIVAARVTFEKLSKTIIDLQKTFGHDGESEHYLTYCPMAFGKGAYWLQDNDTVNNSYYGASMLRCGSVKEIFSAESDKE